MKCSLGEWILNENLNRVDERITQRNENHKGETKTNIASAEHRQKSKHRQNILYVHSVGNTVYRLFII